MTSSSTLAPTTDGGDFSLVHGGPLFRLLLRTHLCNGDLGLLRRRIAVAVLITWAPLLALSALQGALFRDGGSVPFLGDLECQLRFLVVVPLLIGAELLVHKRLPPLIDQFPARGLVRPEQEPRFGDALQEALKLRNSGLAEALLIVLVYAVGILVLWRHFVALHTGSWYAATTPGGTKFSPAGLWLVFVSMPIFQFLLLRWYFRLFLWAKFLWRLSRLDLDLEATHPDRAGGLGFLGGSLNAFLLIGAAHGMLLAGLIANRIFYERAKLTDFKVEILLATIFLVFVFAGPLLVFAPLLARVRRIGIRVYGALAQSYVRAFDEKWVGGGASAEEPLIGSGDIQSLADMGNSFAVVEQMRLTPISRTALLQLVFVILAPLLPLLLTLMPAEKLVDSLLGMVLPG